VCGEAEADETQTPLAFLLLGGRRTALLAAFLSVYVLLVPISSPKPSKPRAGTAATAAKTASSASGSAQPNRGALAESQ
jgi:hypothetical protein